MIAANTVTHTYFQGEGSNTIQLAPFGLEELEQVSPVDLDVFGYHHQSVYRIYSDPELLLEEASQSAGNYWGIYQTTPSHAFLGIVGLESSLVADDTDPANSAHNMPLQDISITIMKEDCQNQGFGTAAIRTAVTYAFARQRTLAVSAYLHPGNTPSQRAFERAGFAHIGNRPRPVPYANGDMRSPQEWQLACDNDAIKRLCVPGTPTIALLEAGHVQYERGLAETIFDMTV